MTDSPTVICAMMQLSWSRESDMFISSKENPLESIGIPGTTKITLISFFLEELLESSYAGLLLASLAQLGTPLRQHGF
jgi:hypothetical protein